MTLNWIFTLPVQSLAGFAVYARKFSMLKFQYEADVAQIIFSVLLNNYNMTRGEKSV